MKQKQQLMIISLVLLFCLAAYTVIGAENRGFIFDKGIVVKISPKMDVSQVSLSGIIVSINPKEGKIIIEPDAGSQLIDGGSILTVIGAQKDTNPYLTIAISRKATVEWANIIPGRKVRIVAREDISDHSLEIIDISLSGDSESSITLDKRSCEKDCSEMFKKGQLKQGLAVEDCIKALCKYEPAGTVHVRHILVAISPRDSATMKDTKRERAETIRKELLAGKDFAAVATSVSDCPSKAAGGDLGVFPRGKMVKEFEDAAFSQEVGKIGPVVITQFGFHIIQVLERGK
jgi:hypothetical protein